MDIANEIVPVIYCVIAVVGIIGNGLVIFFILKSKDRVSIFEFSDNGFERGSCDLRQSLSNLWRSKQVIFYEMMLEHTMKSPCRRIEKSPRVGEL